MSIHITQKVPVRNLRKYETPKATEQADRGDDKEMG